MSLVIIEFKDHKEAQEHFEKTKVHLEHHDKLKNKFHEPKVTKAWKIESQVN